MKTLGCAAARRRLHAFHDAELSVGDQIAVGAHLEWCDECAAVLAELQSLRSFVRLTIRDRVELSEDDDRSFQHSVVSRFKAEEGESFAARLTDMFADMRLVYAGAGASVAALACVLMMLNMMRFVSQDQRPGSLAALVTTLAASAAPTPGDRPVRVVDARLLLSESGGGAIAAESDADFVFGPANSEYELAGVVTREGRVEGLELVRTNPGRPIDREERRALRKLMGAVTRARYEPARVDGLPVAVNKVWPVAAITVHPNRVARDRAVLPDTKGPITSSHTAIDVTVNA